MSRSRFLDILYGILSIPIIVILGGVLWTFLYLAVDSDPTSFLIWVASLIVWLTFTLESLNKLIFDRQALPWPGLAMPVWFRFATLLFTYALIGVIGFKMATEPW